MLKEVIKSICPKKVLDFFRKEEAIYFTKKNIKNNEQKEALRWIRKNSLSMYPYDFKKAYKENDIEVFNDDEADLKYVLYKNQRVYFKRGMSERTIREAFNNSLLEQDENSPHRYLGSSQIKLKNKIVADIGAAEGNFSLDIVNDVRKIYIFESDFGWIEALNKTFLAWKDKVEIIEGFVGGDERENINCIRLDDFFRDKEIDCIKVDIEGNEMEMLKGALNILKEKVCYALICTYHSWDDEINIRSILEKLSFNVRRAMDIYVYLIGEQCDRRGVCVVESYTE